MDFYFGASNSVRSKMYFEWLSKAWVKHFLRTEKENYFVQVTAVKMPSFFHSEDGPLPTKLNVETPSGSIELDSESGWDVKDAENGTLFYYMPRSHNLVKFSDAVSDVRDYFFSMWDNDPNLDVSRRNWPDSVTASVSWHEEQRRILQRRLEAEAALRRSEAVFVQVHEPTKGVDWFYATETPFKLNGRSYALMRLITQHALTYESYIMDHCVHGYGSRIFDGETVILSVRDLESLHTPLITVEVNTSPKPNFIQVKGKSNHNPEDFVKGITGKLRELLPIITEAALKPLSRTDGDLSFQVNLNRR